MPDFKSALRSLRDRLGLKPVRLPELDDRLAEMETVFRAPPFTPSLVDAIKLISPHCDFKPEDQYRTIWEADQNGSCWGEFEALKPLFEVMPTPSRVLEIGPGMGRTLVFFSKKLGWEQAELHAFEGNGSDTKYTINGPRFEDSFCGNITELQGVLRFNGIENTTIFDASTTALKDLPGSYDFLYSFYSIGFHWAIEHFWADVSPLLSEKGIGVFIVTDDFVSPPALADVHQKIIDFKTAWPKDGALKLLVVSKSPLPLE